MTSPELPSELSFDFLKKITNNFSDERKIGGDPFGTLYKGIVPDGGKVIAVKKLQVNAPPDKVFKMEVQHLMALKHENIVQVVGFCIETTKKLVQFNGRYIQADVTESLLCYEYLPNWTLDHYVFGTKAAEDVSTAKPSIDWDTRFMIIRGICQGLHHLHHLASPIINMDLKLECIWLDERMVPKIGNLGLSRIFGQERTSLRTQTVVGSYGYMAPEYLYTAEITAQSDIYSLGLTIIEITTGERNCPEKNQPSARGYISNISGNWTPDNVESKNSSLHSEGLQQVKLCIDIGLKCVNVDPTSRPSIKEIVDRLNGLGW